MALGLFSHYAGDRATAWSGGSEPGESLSSGAVAAMAAVGIDITHEHPKRWTDAQLQEADVIVTMGCGDACPYVPGKRYEDWAIEPGPSEAQRDEIDGRVRPHGEPGPRAGPDGGAGLTGRCGEESPRIVPGPPQPV